MNAATVWSARGDLRSLAALRTSFNRNEHPRIEGCGTRQANRSIKPRPSRPALKFP